MVELQLPKLLAYIDDNPADKKHPYPKPLTDKPTPPFDSSPTHPHYR